MLAEESAVERGRRVFCVVGNEATLWQGSNRIAMRGREL